MKYIAQHFTGNTWLNLTKATSKAAAQRKLNEGLAKGIEPKRLRLLKVKVPNEN